jgi:Fibronectin type III domain
MICARESWALYGLLLAFPLLTGCNATGASSASEPAAVSGPLGQSLSLNTAPTRTLTPASTPPSTSTSKPASTEKSVDVTWTAPTTNTNGSALTDLAGYTIHYGTSAGALNRSIKVANAGASDYVVQGLTDGTWYFAVTAYTNTGLQSSYSSVVSKTIS